MDALLENNNVFAMERLNKQYENLSKPALYNPANLCRRY